LLKGGKGGISLVSACVLIRSEHGKFDEVVKKIKQLKGVERIFPVLGRYDVVVDVEAPEPKTLGNTVLKMGRIAGVVFTETLVEIQY
jgi:uncharacterized protein with GYD domain